MRTLAAACLALSAMTAAPAIAQAPEAVVRGVEGTIVSITAEQRVSARPDLAVIQIGVVSDGATAAAAVADNAQRMTQVLAALRRAGVAERDLQTAQLSVGPQYQYVENEPPRVSSYQAQNTVSAKIRDLTAVGRAVDAAIGQSANQLYGISFELSDPDTALDGARRAALTKARARADLYAQAAGLRVHRILHIQEGGGEPITPYPMPMMARAQAAESTPVQPGEVDLTATVAVAFELR